MSNYPFDDPDVGYDDYDDEPREDDCDHDEYEIDWEGRAQCYRCGHSWWASSKQIAAQEEHERQYQEWVEQQRRPWYRFKEWIRSDAADVWWCLRRLFTPQKRRALDDEIPF